MSKVFGQSHVRRWVGVVAALLSLSLIAAACGNDDESSAANGTGTQATAAPQGSGEIDEDAEISYGLNFIINGGAYFDPLHFNSNAAPRAWMDLIYDTMLHPTASGPEPGLATEWEIIDETTFELTLREGVQFSDGTPFDAHAVKQSWERLRDDTDTGIRLPEIAALELVDVVDDLTVRVNLNAPVINGWFERFLLESNSGLGVVSPAALDASDGDANEAPVGAGPYVFVEYVPDQRVVVERNPDYWNAEEFHFSRITFVQQAAGAPTISALGSGRLDVATITADDLAAIESLSNLDTFSQDSDYTSLINLCATRAPWDDVNARLAIRDALDRQAIVDGAMAGLGSVNPLPLPTSDPLWNGDIAAEVQTDVAGARELAESSGVTSGGPYTLAYATSFAEAEPQATVIQSQLAEIGVNVELEPVQDVVSYLESNDPDLWLMSLRPVSLVSQFGPTGIVNACGSENPELFDAYNAYRDLTKSEAEREELANEFQRIAIESSNSVFLATPANVIAFQQDIEGISYIKAYNQGMRFEGVYRAG
jgi:peptide/nickel transport system substrate-binding protein